MCSDKWRIDGAPGMGQAPQRKPQRITHLGQGRRTLGTWRAGSSLSAGDSASASGKWALAQVCPPRLCRRALGSRAQDRTIRVRKAAFRTPRSPGLGAWPRWFLEGAPTAAPLRPPQTDTGLRGSPATSRQGRALSIKCIHIYIFNCQSLLSRKGPTALGPRVGKGPSGRGRKLRGGGGAWAALEPGARNGFRCAGEVRGLQCPDHRRQRSWVKRCPRAQERVLSSSSIIQETAAVPCVAWPQFPLLQTSGRIPSFFTASSGETISAKPREEGPDPEVGGRIRLPSPF